MAMADAQHMHAKRMADDGEAYQGKLLEARQSDWKDEAVLLILSAPIAVLAWAVVSDDPAAMDKVKLFFDYFSSLPSWFTNSVILVVCQFTESREHKSLGTEEKIMPNRRYNKQVANPMKAGKE